MNSAEAPVTMDHSLKVVKSMEGLFKPDPKEEKYSTDPPETAYDVLVDKCGSGPAKQIYQHLVDDIKNRAELGVPFVPYRSIVVNVEWKDDDLNNEAKASIICPYSGKEYKNLNYNNNNGEIDKCINRIQGKNLRRERMRRASQEIRALSHAFHRFKGDANHRAWKHSYKLGIASMEEARRLMELLSDERNDDCISWLPDGRAFIIRNRKLFAEKVMSKFFPRKSKYSSFTRKLNQWNFKRISSGSGAGAYYHEFFRRDEPHLVAQMF